MAKQENLELVAVGHVTVDRVDGETRLGGAASYAALTGRHLGVKTCVVTAAADEFPYWDRFAGIHRKVLASEHTTELEHYYVRGERRQRVHHLAEPIGGDDIDDLPLADDAAILYCPVVHEIKAPLTAIAPNGLSALAPQGFFRQWDDDGHITVREWEDAERSLAGVDVVCMSESDAEVPEALAEDFPGAAFVITKGASGCRVYSGADVFDFPALPARAVDTTGAGDVFAAALVIALRRGDIVPDAVRFASREAAWSVESVGVEGLL